MQRLIFLVVLVTGLISVYTACPDTSSLTGTSINCNSPQVLAYNSPGVSNFPGSFKQLSLSFSAEKTTATTCGATDFHYFTLTAMVGTQEKIIADVWIEGASNTLKITTDLATTQTVDVGTLTSSDALSAFLSVDLTNGKMRLEGSTTTQVVKILRTDISGGSASFDQTIRLYACSKKGNVSPFSCDVNDVKLIYSFLDVDYLGLSGGLTPANKHFFSLTEGSGTSLPNSIDSTKSGYFGDAATSPTSTSTPVWDTTNAVVSLQTKNQVVTFPMPTLGTPFDPVKASFTITAWVRITSYPESEVTILRIIDSTGATTKAKLVASSSSGALGLYIGSTAATLVGGTATINKDAWSLVGLSIWTTLDNENPAGSLFVGSSQSYFTVAQTASFASTDLLQVGEAAKSFIGQLSAVRIISPGSAFLTSSVCAIESALELGAPTTAFALSCITEMYLNGATGACVASCPGDAYDLTGICGVKKASTDDSPPISGIAAAGIALGSIILIVGMIVGVTKLLNKKEGKGLVSPGSLPS